MIGKILLSLLIGLLIGGAVYVGLGFLRRGRSDGDSEKVSSGGKGKQEGKKRPTDDDDNYGGRARGSGLTPTKEWYGGSRD